MRTLLRNRTTVFYSLPTGNTTKARDRFGNLTGEPVPEYGPIYKYTKLSARSVRGNIAVEPFGLIERYTDTFVTADMNCPITMGARLWIGKCPCDSDGNDFTHVVKAVIPTINVIRIVAEGVSVS